MLSALLALALLAAPASRGTPAPSPAASPGASGPVILFLIDNSASLPPLDPTERRVTALEKMFGFLRGQRYRLLLFGGKAEISVDDPSRYRNEGRWTDFYWAFVKAKELAEGYPRGTELRMVLLTDAISDPDPADWKDVPHGWDVRSHSIRRTIELLHQLRLPLYVVLVGEPGAPGAGEVRGDPEQSPGFVLDMVRAANGQAAAPLAQSLASFFGDDGLLLRKFVYRVRPQEGLKKIEPVVRRIAAPPRAGIELRIFTYFVLPLLLVLVGLLGLLVRSFPGAGDLEILELSVGQPLHVAVDKLHRSSDGVWSAEGLSLAADARGAAATFTLQQAGIELGGVGYDTGGLDRRDAALLAMDLDQLRRALEAATDGGSREEKIHALNLDYAARSLEAAEAERILTRPLAERRRASTLEFVRAKARLAIDDGLRRRLLDSRLQVQTHGRQRARRDLAKGDPLALGRYRFVVAELARGGRKDVRLVLRYARVPSLLGLKTLLPAFFQRAFRFRRSAQRVVG